MLEPETALEKSLAPRVNVRVLTLALKDCVKASPCS